MNLERDVLVSEDQNGVSYIQAANKNDALRVWGFLHARDRFFQMDLLRRVSAGRLAELIGPIGVELDCAQRLFGFQEVARQALALIPSSQRDMLSAYTEGVNTHLQQWFAGGIEYAVLGKRPSPWRAEDSLLVMLNLFQQLALDIDGKRMQICMDKALPPSLVKFFTPKTDAYSTVPAEKTEIPIDDLQVLIGRFATKPLVPVVSDMQRELSGSNCWVLAAEKTARRTPLLANDMHLPYSAPNIWHRVELCYESTRVSGIAVPGIPVVVAGSNGILAWGMTNVPGDLTELVPFESLDGPVMVRTREERIVVSRSQTRMKVLHDCRWGPVLPQSVCGQRVALEWSALWPASVHLGLSRLIEATSLDEAITIAHEGGCPPLNIHFAHRNEGIAHTVAGLIPLRLGRRLQYGKFVPANRLPCARNPESGYLITVNDPPLVEPDNVEPGWNYPGAYRRSRLEECLALRDDWNEADTISLARDNRSGFYDFYHELALAIVESAAALGWQDRQRNDLKTALLAWDGCFGRESRGIAVLCVLRRRLLGHMFSYYLKACAQIDPEFQYTWRNPEPPLRQLLSQRPATIVPEPSRYKDWEDYLAGTLAAVCDSLENRMRRSVAEITWGDFQKVQFLHPFGNSIVGRILSLPSLPSDGGDECVAAVGTNRGPTQRMAVSPGWELGGLFEMPGGQSSSPWSSHFRDHHRAWIRQSPVPLRSSNFSSSYRFF